VIEDVTDSRTLRRLQAELDRNPESYKSLVRGSFWIVAVTRPRDHAPRLLHTRNKGVARRASLRSRANTSDQPS